MSHVYRFVGEVERVFGHLRYKTPGSEEGNASVLIDGAPVDAGVGQTVELHPGGDVRLITDEPQNHAELVPVDDAAPQPTPPSAPEPVPAPASVPTEPPAQPGDPAPATDGVTS